MKGNIVFVPEPPNLRISYGYVAYSNIFDHFEAVNSQDVWLTNTFGYEVQVIGHDYDDAIVGPVIKVAWTNAGQVVLQQSLDLTNWSDTPMNFPTDNGVWYEYPQNKKFFKLRAK